MNKKVIRDLKRAKTIQFLEENIRVNLHDLGFRYDTRRINVKKKKQINWTLAR